LDPAGAPIGDLVAVITLTDDMSPIAAGGTSRRTSLGYRGAVTRTFATQLTVLRDLAGTIEDREVTSRSVPGEIT
jgi:hypothetical protein